MTTCNVADFIREHAARAPDQPALRFPAAGYRTERPVWDTLTFREFDQQSDAFARGFRARGVRRGDRALLLIRPSLRFYTALFGLFKLGAVPVLLDPGMGLKALLACIERTRPRVALALPAVFAVGTFYRRPLATVELRFTDGRRWFWGGHRLEDAAEPSATPFDIERMDPADDAAILFTSGSTGLAKGVASKHGMFRAQVAALREMLNLQPGWTDVQCFAGFAIFDLCLGLTSVLPRMDLSKPAKANPADIVAALQTFAPEVAFASPIVWQNTTRWCQAKAVRLDSLTVTLTVGAPIPAPLQRRFREILAPGRQVFTPYGATEAMPLTNIGTDEVLDDAWPRTAAGAGTCVGRPIPSVDLRIIRITDEPLSRWEPSLELPPGEIGEVVVKGPVVSPEYKDVPEANRAAKIPDGDGVWHRMGDLGYLDEQGRLWFCGRKAHRLHTAQGMLPADPLEGIFNEHPAVFRTALVGVGPPGQAEPVLVVEMEPGQVWRPELADELAALAAPTPYAGRVRRFLPHPGFPVDARHNSKIRREDLAPWAASQSALQGAR